MELSKFEDIFKEKVVGSVGDSDPSHDLAHFMRVVVQARALAQAESAQLEIVIPAAWLHDLVNIPKSDPRRKQASTLSADAAIKFLKKVGYPEKFYGEIYHSIQAHSYSAGIEAKTIESKVVQDADRLDALGAIGVARCFATGGLMKRAFYDVFDPFAEERTADDSKYTIDHFYTKLLRLVSTFQTTAGKQEAQLRTDFMQAFLHRLRLEVK